MKKFEESFKDVQDKSNYNLKLEKNEELQNEFRYAISREPLLNSPTTGLYARVGKYLRIFSYLFLFTGVGIVFNSCVGGYIVSEPAYVEYARPQRPAAPSSARSASASRDARAKRPSQTAAGGSAPFSGQDRLRNTG